MIVYPEVHLARFLCRPNRFIAECELIETGEQVTVHVKNTGRGKEVLLPGAKVALSHRPSPKRKTAYDLIAVKKAEQWFNIDSQVPNALAAQALLDGDILLPNLNGAIRSLKREQRYGHSKFDIFIETDKGQKAFVEVKGMTLENDRIGAFPDAPTLRGLKHVKELTEAISEGYQCYVLFIAQFELLDYATINKEMQPALAQAIFDGQQAGLTVLAYNCHVLPESIQVVGKIPFDLEQAFIQPV
ncbi:sugar fermentation stimulation protein [Enterococcus sp. 9E7_DIV0242]|uniref:Sugar fermentation stimulation protein homolog n=1 Tax=Candidatus Enterococcus clewellii TaxID=1834193 RepID=A0A242K4L2_9ENTE|nr:sugar fermentation stimulation protein [Enterococcus sp. 9E7_DIV0242]